MRSIIALFLLLPLLSQSQTCDNCIGVPAVLTANPVGVAPFTYVWTCTDGSSSTTQEHTTNNVTTSFTCVVNITDANGCAAINNVTVSAIQPPSLVIQVASCVISWATQNLGSNTCTSYQVQRQPTGGGSWTNVSSSLPYTATVNANYRIAYTCTCGTFYSNTLAVTGCVPCTPFTIFNWGDCDLVITGTVPCSSGPFQIWQAINNSIDCDAPNPCAGVTYTLYQTTTNYFAFVNNDGCYYMTTTCGGITYCSNVICFEDDCNVGCSGGIVVGQTGCNMSVTWATCTTTSWNLQYFNTSTSTWTTYSSGTTSPATSFAIPWNGQWRVNQNCSNGCTYTSVALTFSSCGAQPCGSTTTVAIVQNPDPCTSTATLTAVVTNCGNSPYAPTYAWSNGATTQAINVGSGTYTVTVTGCCTTPVTATKVLTCTNPCAGFNVNITGATTLCTTASTTLSASITGGTAAFTYLWKINGVNSGTASTLNINGASYSPGIITISLTVTDANGCTDIDVHQIEIQNCSTACDCTPTLSFNSGTCELTLSFSGVGCSSYTGYGLLKWNATGCTGGNTTVQSGSTVSFPLTVSVSENKWYQLVITGAGCTTKASSCVAVTGCGGCPSCTVYEYSVMGLHKTSTPTADLELYHCICPDSEPVSSGTINWGDGNTQAMATSYCDTPLHAYSSTGQRTVTVSGSTTNGGSFQSMGRVNITGSVDFPTIFLGGNCYEGSTMVIDGNGASCNFTSEVYFKYQVRDNAGTYSVSSYTFTIDGVPYTLDTHDTPTGPGGDGDGYIYNSTPLSIPKENGHIPYVLTATLNTGTVLTISGTFDLTCTP